MEKFRRGRGWVPPGGTFPRVISKTVERLISWLPARERDAKLEPERPESATFARIRRRKVRIVPDKRVRSGIRPATFFRINLFLLCFTFRTYSARMLLSPRIIHLYCTFLFGEQCEERICFYYMCVICNLSFHFLYYILRGRESFHFSILYFFGIYKAYFLLFSFIQYDVHL